MIILLFKQWDAGVGGSWIVRVSVVNSFELYFSALLSFLWSHVKLLKVSLALFWS